MPFRRLHWTRPRNLWNATRKRLDFAVNQYSIFLCLCVNGAKLLLLGSSVNFLADCPFFSMRNTDQGFLGKGKFNRFEPKTAMTLVKGEGSDVEKCVRSASDA